MYRAKFEGDHYSAGLSFGKAMLQNGASLENSHIMKSGPERVTFAEKCVEVLDKIYSQVISELRGIADGQQISFEKLSAFILGMYCFEPPCFCSCVASNAGGKVIFGRNSDFFTALEDSYGSFLHREDGAYSFLGNSTAFTEIEDGVNEHGLAVGITFVVPKRVKPGLNTGLLARFLLERCKTVDEAISAVKKLPIATAQTLTLADKTGKIAVIECCCDALEVIYPQDKESFVYAVNLFSGEKTKPHSAVTNDEQNLFAKRRAEDILAALKKAEGREDTMYIKELLSGKYGFICQYDRKSGFDTVWSSLYELSDKRISICEGNPSRAEFEARNELDFA